MHGRFRLAHFISKIVRQTSLSVPTFLESYSGLQLPESPFLWPFLAQVTASPGVFSFFFFFRGFRPCFKFAGGIWLEHWATVWFRVSTPRRTFCGPSILIHKLQVLDISLEEVPFCPASVFLENTCSWVFAGRLLEWRKNRNPRVNPTTYRAG